MESKCDTGTECECDTYRDDFDQRPMCHCKHDKCCGLRDEVEFSIKCTKCRFYKWYIEKD